MGVVNDEKMEHLILQQHGAPAPEGRQGDIIRAAAKIFREKGYHAATIRDIAAEVGLLKGSLYHHIKGKEQLLMDVVMSAVTTLQAGIEEVMRRDLTPKARLRQFIIAHMRSFDTHYNEVSVFFNEISHLPLTLREQLYSRISAYEDMWLEIIRAAIECGEFREDVDPRVTVYAIFGMCNWTHKWYRSSGRLRNTEIAEIYADLVVLGLDSRSTGTNGGSRHE